MLVKLATDAFSLLRQIAGDVHAIRVALNRPEWRELAAALPRPKSEERTHARTAPPNGP